MMLVIKRSYTAVSLAILSTYCGAVVAFEGAADKTIPAAAAAVTAPPSAPPASGPSQKEIIVGSLGMFGRLCIMVAVVWLIVDVVRRIAGGKPKFFKPMMLLVVGAALFYLPRGMIN
jgi:hypothetical protein